LESFILCSTLAKGPYPGDKIGFRLGPEAHDGTIRLGFS
jgi:hypothetical protein